MKKYTPAILTFAASLALWSCEVTVNGTSSEEVVSAPIEETVSTPKEETPSDVYSSQEATSDESPMTSEEVIPWTKENYVEAIGSALNSSNVGYTLEDLAGGNGGTGSLLFMMQNSEFIDYFTENNSFNFALKKITGIAPFTKEVSEYGGTTADDFNHINPAFITWLGQNLDIQPTDKVGSATAQEHYNKYMKNQSRLLLATHDYLVKKGWASAEAGYKKASDMSISSKDGDILQEHLYQTYAHTMTKGFTPPLEFFPASQVFYPGVVAGFWLRRRMDGSEAVIYDFLQRVVKDFDPSFEGERANYKYKYDSTYDAIGG